MEAKHKKHSSKKRIGGGSTPQPALCGHSHCKPTRCCVRYVGAVSHPMHHHILHAARGVSNIWTAVVITGLSLVLTGAVAYTAVEAKTTERDALTRNEYVRMINRVQEMEKSLKVMREICDGRAPAANVDTSKTVKPLPVEKK